MTALSDFVPVDLLQLGPSELLRQAAAHEAGHTVVGAASGFDVIETRIGITSAMVADGFVAGGTVFVAPDGDQKELARRHPDEFAIVAMSGFCAEQMLTGQYLDDGYKVDLDILRVGKGWIDGMDPSDAQTLLVPLIEASNEAVRQRRREIEEVATHLYRYGVIDGATVAAIVAS